MFGHVRLVSRRGYEIELAGVGPRARGKENL